MSILHDFGWRPEREHALQQTNHHFQRDLVAARIVRVEKGQSLAVTSEAVLWATVSGRFEAHADGPDDFPVVGDWVALHPHEGMAIIEAVLPRVSFLTRRASGHGKRSQPICANVDTVLATTSVGSDFSPRRLQRYRTAIEQSGAETAILVNKTDLAHDRAAMEAELESMTRDVEVLWVSCRDGEGLAPLKALLRAGGTYALVGSSGVGKSSIINALVRDEVVATREVRTTDGKGRHTTTSRQLHRIPGGALLIDTPGMREFGLWEAEDGLASAFAEITPLAESCRFADCTHSGEPGCRVRAALEAGEISPERAAAWAQLRRELAYQERQKDPQHQANTKKRWRAIHKGMRDQDRLERRCRRRT